MLLAPHHQQLTYSTQTRTCTQSKLNFQQSPLKRYRRLCEGRRQGKHQEKTVVWHILVEIPKFLETLAQLFNACIDTGYNPSHLQRSITVVLRKLGKSDYQLAKSYGPVALLNTLGKFLEAVDRAKDQLCSWNQRLTPTDTLGGRKGVSTDHVIRILIDRIKDAWGKGKAVGTLFLLDVSGAYDNISHARLLHPFQTA
ncbi:reverse transcriptase [Penicillium sp. DV-2018c]|nr:reverse transcriptase [Penicillium sp. DV-2018c]KAJ5567656.1 reverse transcriptase [Penicillium sp. DV-2018c]